MDSEQARQVLCGYQATNSPTDEERAALALVEIDRELAAWYQEEQDFDQAIRTKLAEVIAPTEAVQALQEQLAMGNKVVAVPSSRMSRRQVFAMAATFASLFTVVGLLIQGRARHADDLATFRSDMVRFVRELTGTDLTKGNHTIIATALKNGGAPMVTDVLARFGEGNEMGCMVRDWHEHRVAMICLKVDDAGHVAHLFAIAKEAFSTTAKDQLDHVIQEQNLSTKAWKEGGHYFLLVGGSEDTPLPNV